jgi:hypothetical protein
VTLTEMKGILQANGLAPDLLNWVPLSQNPSTSGYTYLDLIEEGFMTIHDLIAQEAK